MKRLVLALLATQNLAHAGVIMVDEAAAKKLAVLANAPNASVATASVPATGASAAASAAAASVGAGSPAAASALKPAPTWAILVSDKSVRGVLERWSKTAGYQLLWEVPVDLELNANATLTGTYEEALNAVLASLATSDYPVEAMIYENRAVRVVKRAPKGQQ
jgi:type IV pili sensor histidine kinase/response regulator